MSDNGKLKLLSNYRPDENVNNPTVLRICFAYGISRTINIRANVGRLEFGYFKIPEFRTNLPRVSGRRAGRHTAVFRRRRFPLIFIRDTRTAQRFLSIESPSTQLMAMYPGRRVNARFIGPLTRVEMLNVNLISTVLKSFFLRKIVTNIYANATDDSPDIFFFFLTK